MARPCGDVTGTAGNGIALDGDDNSVDVGGAVLGSTGGLGVKGDDNKA